jgi:predicted transposase/invertase (TIGR01784 family)
MISGIDPKVDYAFKRIFGIEANTPILLDLLNAVLDPPPGRRIEALELCNPFNEKETSADKLSIVDVKARDERGEYYNVEMQMHAGPAYPERVLYYWAKIYSNQLAAADDYDELKPTFSISFVNDVLFADVPEYHSIFELRNVLRPQVVFSPCQAIHLVELPKFRKRVEDLGGPFDRWCYFLKHAASLDSEQLPAVLHSPALERALEVLNVISKTDLERERYLAAERWERDHRTFVRAAEIAEAKGVVIGRIHVYQRLLNLPQTAINNLRTRSIADLEAEARMLEGKLTAK